jgi:hypothetical protein
MMADSIPQLKSLSVAKKRRLIVELLDVLYGAPVKDRDVAAALGERGEHFRSTPASGRDWQKNRLNRL